MKKLLFLLLLIPFLGNSQATFTAPVGYNTGAPTATPSGVGTRWRFDLLTGKKYTWLPGSLSWDEDARGIDQVAGCSAPLYTPGYNQSTFAVNACSPPVLYQWTGAAWEIPNEPEVYTAGTGISIDGSNVITNTSPNIVQTLSIAGQDLSLSNGGGTVAIPADGNGIYGGSGTVPGNTIGTNTVTLGVQRLEFTDVVDGIYSENLIGTRLTDADGRTAKAGLESSLTANEYYDPEDEESEENIVTYPFYHIFAGDNFTTGDKSSTDIKVRPNRIEIGRTFTDDADAYGTATVEIEKEFYAYGEETEDGGSTTISGQANIGMYGMGVQAEHPTSGTVSFTATPGQVIFDVGGDGSGASAAYIPSGITNTVGGSGEILLQALNEAASQYTSLSLKGVETIFTDADPVPLGIQYNAYYPDIETSPQSLADVQTVNSLKQKLATYTTAQRDAISSPATGHIIYNTDATATDGSTGVMQVWNGSVWKNAW